MCLMFAMLDLSMVRPFEDTETDRDHNRRPKAGPRIARLREVPSEILWCFGAIAIAGRNGQSVIRSQHGCLTGTAPRRLFGRSTVEMVFVRLGIRPVLVDRAVNMLGWTVDGVEPEGLRATRPQSGRF